MRGGRTSDYPPKAPALTGVFYCFNGLTNPFNQPSIPGTIARIERAFLLLRSLGVTSFRVS